MHTPRPLCPPAAFVAALALLCSPASVAEAQTLPPRPIVAASGRVTTSVSFDGRVMGGGFTWLNRSTGHSGPARIILDYGQPHARGRTIFGGLVPFGEVWRLGANLATHLTLDVDLRIGDLDIPRGMYTLFLLPRPDGAALIVNRQVRHWGTDYDASRDFGRIELRARSLSETVESLTMTLEPIFPQSEGELPSGVLRIAWGEMEYSGDWRVTWPEGP